MEQVTYPTIRQICIRSHELAQAKGWYTLERDEETFSLLAASELMEAFEEYRSGRPLTDIYTKNGSPKPEGFAIEIADFFIRVADYAGAKGIAAVLADLDMDIDLTKTVALHAFGMQYKLQSLLHEALRRTVAGDYSGALSTIYALCGSFHIDLAAAVEMKHAFNVTRPHLHGGKIA